MKNEGLLSAGLVRVFVLIEQVLFFLSHGKAILLKSLMGTKFVEELIAIRL